MKQNIESILQELEEQKSIQILYACESGSRAWGFESPDSDYDIRFIYKRTLADYVRIDPIKNTLEFFSENNLLDFSGWDINKALFLFSKSNPALFEWLASPIIYKEETNVIPELRELKTDYFNPKGTAYHYANIAKSNYKSYLTDNLVNQKKYLYVLRALLAIEWIAKYNTMPPTEFEKLLVLVRDQTVLNELQKLLDEKKKSYETEKKPRNNSIHTFIEEKMKAFDDIIDNLKDNKQPIEKLNELFFRIVTN